jgi:Flp pilus assembly protein TadD
MTAMTNEQILERAAECQKAGRLEEAEALCRTTLSANGDQPEALRVLAIIAQQTGRAELALQLLDRACALRPDAAVFHAMRGIALASIGQIDQAIVEHRRAIELGLADSESFNNLGSLLSSKGRLVEALSVLNQAISLNGSNARAHNTLGAVLGQLRRFDEALVAFARSLSIQPSVIAYVNQGIVFGTLGRLDEAITAFEKALQLDPESADAHTNLGNALKGAGRFGDAVAACRKALAFRPDASVAHHNLGQILLLTGDFQNGWLEYEWRTRAAPDRIPNRRFDRPRWDGSPLVGRRLFVYGEQGFGDTIQFARFIPTVSVVAGAVTFECQPMLHRLFSRVAGVEKMISPGQSSGAFDVHCPLMSLPLVFRTNLHTIPHDVPYVSADPQLAARWRGRIDAEDRRLIVGLAWAGMPTHINDRERSIRLAAMAPLADVSGVRFFSLQKGAGAKQAKSPPAGMDLTDWSGELTDFADTAALIAALDLVICVDTAVAHLAGALAQPTWVLLPYVPDWRWLLDRNDSPWYPTMRLFRQPKIGDWQTPINEIALALRGLVSQGGAT